MKIKSSSNKAVSSEYRQRIDAITGKMKVTPEMLRGSLAPLLASLERQRSLREQSHAAHLRDLEKLAKARGPIPKPSTKEMSAFNAIRKARLNSRPRMVEPPVVPGISPQVRSGSILTFDAPPYWYQWSAGTSPSVNKLDGTWRAGCGVAGRYAYSYAGIAVYIKALPGPHQIRFAPFMPINWSYDLETTTMFFGSYARAWARGFLGIYVAAYSDGQWVKLRDDRVSVFDRYVTVNTDESDSGDSISNNPQSTFWTYQPPLYYGLMAWGGVETYASSSYISYGMSFASLACSIPWMAIEQYV